MEWTRVEAGHHRSVSPVKYVITLEGVGLFREGWRPSWRLRKGDGHLVGEHGSLRAAKSHAESCQRVTREGKKRILSRIRKNKYREFQTYFTCVHEAGHMIVERMTSNRRIFSATCVPGGGFLGLVRVVMPQGAVDPETAKGMIMTGLAGDIATALVAESKADSRK
jgi:hypothetical protein